MGDGHGHEVTATGEHRNRLIVVLVITSVVLIVEVIGGLVAGSLALLADAGHMLTDSTGLILALIAASLATHGYARHGREFVGSYARLGIPRRREYSVDRQ